MEQNNVVKFGDFNGTHLPETLIPALEESDYNYEKLQNDRKPQSASKCQMRKKTN